MAHGGTLGRVEREWSAAVMRWVKWLWWMVEMVDRRVMMTWRWGIWGFVEIRVSRVWRIEVIV